MAYDWHRPLEKRWVSFTLATFAAVIVGGLVLLVPPLALQGTIAPLPGLRPYADAERIAADPAYGHVVCFCERVTAGEVRDAFDSAIPPRDMDGLRRRTRLMNGRCQGFFCGADAQAALETCGASLLAGADR